MTTCLCWVRLMWCTMAATVELFPLPLTPVTSMSPRSDSASCSSASGRRSDSSVGTVNGITRMTIMNEERCRSTLTRNRPTPGHPPGAVEVPQPVDPGAVLVAADELEGDGPRLIGGQPLLGEGHQLAVDPGPENIARLDVQVGGAALDRRLDDLFHAPSGPSGGRRASHASGPGTPCVPAPRAWSRRPGGGPLAAPSPRIWSTRPGSCCKLRARSRIGARVRDHVVGQHPLAVEAAPFGAAAVVRHPSTVSGGEKYLCRW